MQRYDQYGQYIAQQQQPFDQQYAQTAANEYHQQYDAERYQQQQQYPQQEQQQQQQQQASSVRWSWSIYPTTRLDAARMVAPLGCMYTPLGQPCFELPRAPLACTRCGGIMNPYSVIQGYSWTCPLCGETNQFPSNIGRIDAGGIPAELTLGQETIEYVEYVDRRPPTFFFVVDTCVDAEEVDYLRDYLRLAVAQIPETAYVGMISYGATVRLHEISGLTAYPRSVVLRGSQEITPELLQGAVPKPERFIAPLCECSATLSYIIDNLQQDLWPVEKGSRPLRCTGAAVSAAASLLQIVTPGVGSCVMAFMSGACTIGPGTVVDTNRENMIRGHSDIRDSTATAAHWEKSCNFYDNLMRRIVAQGHALTCFTASLDQLGIAEMKVCIQCSGGVVLNAESWGQEPFRRSLHQFFARRSDGALRMGLNATFDVITSPTWKVLGVIGPCVGTGKKSTSVGEYEIGLGGTCQWTTCMLDDSTTLAIYYDSASSPADTSRSANRYTQIITRYEIGNENRTRVTTLVHQQQNNPTHQDLCAAFDQEAAVALLARQAIHKTDSTPLFDVMRWLDRTTVRLVSRFGDYTRDSPASLRIPPQFVYFPAFIFHLRRSGYLQVFNSSPDESAILRLQLLKSSVEASIVQIQPTLYSYRMDAPPQPVSLDSSAIQADNILLLDTFFEVLIHYGATIAAWKKAGYAEQEEYAHFREFLETPLQDADVLVQSRYPTPRLIDVCQDDPDGRILYNRINPSRSYAAAEAGEAYGQQEGELVYTDDASLQVFMDHLKKLVVSQ